MQEPGNLLPGRPAHPFVGQKSGAGLRVLIQKGGCLAKSLPEGKLINWLFFLFATIRKQAKAFFPELLTDGALRKDHPSPVETKQAEYDFNRLKIDHIHFGYLLNIKMLILCHLDGTDHLDATHVFGTDEIETNGILGSSHKGFQEPDQLAQFSWQQAALKNTILYPMAKILKSLGGSQPALVIRYVITDHNKLLVQKGHLTMNGV
jgi:hypothetical protein